MTTIDIPKDKEELTLSDKTVDDKFSSKKIENFRKEKKMAKKFDKKSKRGKKFTKKEKYGESNERFEDKTNNPGWYAPTQQLLRDTATYPFANAVGNSIRTISRTDDDYLASIPGIMKLSYMPTFGALTDKTSPLNMSSRNIFSFMRHGISGIRHYNANDVLTYLVPMTSIFSYWTWLTRLYGIHRYYVLRNKYVPEAIFTALGVDYDDFCNHLADFRAKMNTVSAKLSSYAIPNTMPIMARQLQLCSSIYKDAPHDKAQIFMYSPVGFYKYNPKKYATGGCCEFTPFMHNIESDGDLVETYKKSWTVAELFQYFETLIDPIFEDEDFNLIAADIETSFGTQRCAKLLSIPDDYSILPEYSPEMVEQTQNAIIVGVAVKDTAIDDGKGVKFKTWDLHQDLNWGRNLLRCVPAVASDYKEEMRKKVKEFKLDKFNYLTNTYVTDVTPEIVIENTRLQPILHYNVDGENMQISIHNCGSEIVNNVDIFHLPGKDLTLKDGYLIDAGDKIGFGITRVTSNLISEFDSVNNHDTPNRHYCLGVLALLSNFRCHPIMYISWNNGRAKRLDPLDTSYEKGLTFLPFGEISNYQFIDETALDTMHNTAILGEFTLPEANFVINSRTKA